MSNSGVSIKDNRAVKHTTLAELYQRLIT